VRVREARPDEGNEIAETHAASATVAYAHIFPGQPFPMEATRRRWREFPGRIVVAEEGGRLLGFAAFDDQWLHALFVVPERWGAGVGHALLDAAGPVRLLWVLADNPRPPVLPAPRLGGGRRRGRPARRAPRPLSTRSRPGA